MGCIRTNKKKIILSHWGSSTLTFRGSFWSQMGLLSMKLLIMRICKWLRLWLCFSGPQRQPELESEWGAWIRMEGGRRKMVLFKYYFCAPCYCVPITFLICLTVKTLGRRQKSLIVYKPNLCPLTDWNIIVLDNLYCSRDTIDISVHS